MGRVRGEEVSKGWWQEAEVKKGGADFPSGLIFFCDFFKIQFGVGAELWI